MKKFFSKENLGGKGFITAICICILAVGGIGLYSYSKAADKLNEELINANKSNAVTEADNAEQANAEQQQVKKTEKNTEETTAPQTEAAQSETSETEAKKDAYTVYVRPVNGEVICEFSNGELVKSKTLNVWKTHDGVDISAKMGEKVKSMTSGTVTQVYNDPMLGVTVEIDHENGLVGFYSNLSEDVAVSEGQTVSAGTIIGSVGSTAEGEIEDEPHLHFALKKNGEWIDPIALISGEGS
ncbi:MAG: peptidoglycan DD-metalloendopeptidase family protein [Oscillospiraceae bacterium]